LNTAPLFGLLLAIFVLGAPSASFAQAPNVNATLDDNVPAGTYKQNGQTIDYTVVITNSGGDASAVTLTDPTPNNTTFVAGSLHASPLAFTDGPYSATGNTKLYVGTTPPGTEPARVVAGPSLLNNDTISTSPDTIVLTGGTSATTQGGSVTVNTDGTFTYTPPVGFTGTDTFTYAIHNSADATLADTGSVSVTVTDVVWYVNAAAGAGGNGTSASPFNLITSVNGASAAGSFIYVYTGTYNGGLTLKNAQVLTSETNALVVGGNTLRNAQAVAVPMLSHSGTSTVLLSTGNTIDGFNITNSVGNGISGSAIGTTQIADITVTVSGGTALNATGSGTLTVTGTVNTLSNTSGTALNVANVNIGAAGLTFQSISAANGASGIVLSNTGALGGLTVTGCGDTTVGGNNCGGTIQNTTGVGISLTSTLSPSFTNMRVLNTTGHGVGGTDVTNFTFNYGKIDGSHTDALSTSEEANIGFYVNEANSTRNNLDGTVLIVGNQLTNAQFHGVDIFNFSGTIANATISNNTITSTTSNTTSQGSGIRVVAFGSASTVANITKATIDGNHVTNFPGGSGIQVQGGNGNLAGPATGFVGHVGSATDVINITNNVVSGASAANRIAAFGISATDNGRGQANFNIDGNTVSNTIGNGVNVGSFGFANTFAQINDNTLDLHNQAGAAGIGAGTSQVVSNTETPTLTVYIDNNTTHNVDGNGILVTARDATGVVNAHITNNHIDAPLGGNRNGIRVDAGNGISADDVVNLEIFGNTTAGVNLGPEGIGLRKEGTAATVNDFNIYDASGGPSLAANPTNAQVVAFVGALNPNSTVNPGTGDRVLIISGNAYQRTTTSPPLLAAEGGVEAASAKEPHPARTRNVSSPPVEQSRTAGDSGSLSHAERAVASEFLTQQQLDSIASAALSRWSATGLTPEQIARLRALRFEVTALGDLHLGEAAGNVIRIDRKAAGNGWFIDPTPMDDAEFAGADAGTRRYTDPSGAPAGRIDLLTTVMHEMGHRLGLADAYGAQDRDGVMYGYLTKGERRLPTARDAAAARVDKAFRSARWSCQQAGSVERPADLMRGCE
jgi:hypothetical protein